MARATFSRIKTYTKWILAGCIAGVLLIQGSTIAFKLYSQHAIIKQAQVIQETLFAPVVRIVSEYDTPYGKRWHRGTGVIVYSKPNQNGSRYDTYVLTANHVVETPIHDGTERGNEQYQYYDMSVVGTKHLVTYVEYFHTATGESIKVPARVIAHSPNNIFGIDKDGNMKLIPEHWSGKKSGEDLALLKMESDEQFRAAKLIPADRIVSLKVLDQVRLVGSALADKPVPTLGEISRIEPEIGYMQVTAPIIFGNSGGACYLAETGEFIGITNAVRQVSTPEGLSVPVSHMALVRPIQRIYGWLDSVGYRFIYDPTVSDEFRYEAIQRERYKRHFESKRTKEALQGKIQKLDRKIEGLEQEAGKSLLQCLREEFSLQFPPSCMPECK